MNARLTPAAIVATALALTASAPAGDLNPPPGPVAPTMKPLDALAPGVCINTLPGAPDAVHLITEPGHYVLTADVIAPAGTSAIVVDLNPALQPGTHKVSIDLAGHDLLGDPGSLHAIHFRPTAPGVKKECDAKKHKDIIASRIDGFGGSAILSEGDTELSLSGLTIANSAGHAIECLGAFCIRVTDIKVLSAGGDGLHIQNALECVLRAVRIEDCAGSAIHATAGAFAAKRKFASEELADREAELAKMARCGTAGGAPTVSIDGFDDVQLSGLSILDAAGHAIQVTNAQRLDASNLRLEQCTLDGLHAEDTLEIDLGAIQITDCGDNGIEVLRGRRFVRATWSLPDDVPTDDRIANTGSHAILLTDIDEFEIGFIRTTEAGGSAVFATASAAPVRKKAKTKGSIIVNGGGSLATAAVHLTGFDDVEIESLHATEYAHTALDASVTTVGATARVGHVHAVAAAAAPALPAFRLTGFDDVDLTGDVFVSGYPGAALDVSVNPLNSDVQRMKNQGKNVMCSDTGAATVSGYDLVNIEGFTSLGSSADALTVTGASRVRNSYIRIDRSAGDGLVVQADELELDNVALTANTGAGARLTVSGDLRVSNAAASDNGEQGLVATGFRSGTYTLWDYLFSNNGAALPGGAAGLDLVEPASVSLSNGQCRANNGPGIRLADFDRDAVLDRVVCSSNSSHGIHVTAPGGIPNGRCRVTHATCDANTGNGLYLESSTGGEVADCNLTNNNGIGLFISNFGHVVHRNSCIGNTNPILVPVPGNVLGPLVDEMSVGANCSPAANYID